MNITILCSSADHPVNAHICAWIDKNVTRHSISLVRKKDELIGGDLLFLISSNEIIRAAERKRFGKVLVIHASDLPQGRGWSPHVWQVIEGATSIIVTLLEAEDRVDSGAIWKKIRIDVPNHALYDEINQILFEAETELMSFAVEHFELIDARPQSSEIEASYYRKRSPQDSEIDPNKTISEQFDILRICDPNRFPAYFSIRGHTYAVIIRKHNLEEI